MRMVVVAAAVAAWEAMAAETGELVATVAREAWTVAREAWTVAREAWTVAARWMAEEWLKVAVRLMRAE